RQRQARRRAAWAGMDAGRMPRPGPGRDLCRRRRRSSGGGWSGWGPIVAILCGTDRPEIDAISDRPIRDRRDLKSSSTIDDGRRGGSEGKRGQGGGLAGGGEGATGGEGGVSAGGGRTGGGRGGGGAGEAPPHRGGGPTSGARRGRGGGMSRG